MATDPMKKDKSYTVALIYIKIVCSVSSSAGAMQFSIL